MTDRINIHEPIFDLCHRLGLTPENVGEITFRPTSVTATVYRLNSDGAKYLGDDGKAAVDELTFKVTT